MAWLKRVSTLAFVGVITLVLIPRSPIAGQQLSQGNTAAASETPEDLEQLVAPIALYPDALVAQILAASTYPTEVVQADRWLQQNRNLGGAQLAAVVDRQTWDPSVKALTAFPSVLANLDTNLSWTEALGSAYFNQQQDVLDAVQVMRQRAEAAGNLQTTSQERVVSEGPTIVIEPASPEICYVPIYDPWIVYGAPFAPYPGYFYDGWYGPPFISFGPAIGLGFFGRFGWGWPAWGFNWGRRVVVFNHNTYFSRSAYFLNRRPFIGGRAFALPRTILPSVRAGRSFNNRTTNTPNARFGNGWANRAAATPRANAGSRVGAVNGGTVNRGSIFRGAPGAARSSFGGGARPGFGGSGRSFGGGVRGGGGSRGGGGRRH